MSRTIRRMPSRTDRMRGDISLFESTRKNSKSRDHDSRARKNLFSNGTTFNKLSPMPPTGAVTALSFGSASSKNFKVVIRVRPPLQRELNGDGNFQNIVEVDRSCRQITLSENLDATDTCDAALIYTRHTFTFDHVYDQDSDQESVYHSTARSAVLSTLQGYNATVLAYGQTGTGKTFTMEGSAEHQPDRGIIPRAIQEIFQYIQVTASPSVRFLVRASYLQIYNEVISDLLKPERNNLLIREGKKRGVFVEGLSEWVVRSPKEIYGLMRRGAAVRATGATKMNEISSRSHAVFIIIVEQNETDDADGNGMKAPEVPRRQTFKVGKLNLVDLAGSERVRISGATGQRLEESKKINQSLSALGNVIAALTERKKRAHIPYRDSKLTRILEDSLGGNCKTTMMAMVSPAVEAFLESISTLKFANRAKNIKNEATINEDLDEKALLRKYERELKHLRQELSARSRNVVDKRKLLELEEQRRRAERDKMAAIIDLERLSRDLITEKREKQQLEARIQEMTSQLLVGGSNVEDTPQFRDALALERKRIREKYNERVLEMEREREGMEHNKNRVDRYKQLLIKQRDIMIQLTARLNERDQSILVLQEELDAYDQQQRAMEDALDEKTAALIRLQKITMQNKAENAEMNDELSENTEAPNTEIQRREISLSDTERVVRGEKELNDELTKYKSDLNECQKRCQIAESSLALSRDEVRSLKEEGEQHMKTENKDVCDDDERSSVPLKQFDQLERLYTTQFKERVALRSILENKVKALVDSIGFRIENDSASVSARTRREVDILRRLVNASVAAIRHSDRINEKVELARSPRSRALKV